MLPARTAPWHIGGLLRASRGGFSMRFFLTVAAVFGLLWSGILPGHADKRVALVIGNSSYRNVASLPNPVNDASAMVETFKAARFDVVELRRDVGIGDLRRAIGDFAGTAADADIAVVYFAGHGIEVDGTNYLIPVDAHLARDFDVEDETVSLDRVLRAVEPARRLRLVIVDACRVNPFLRTMKRSVASRSVGRGLGRVEPATANTLVAFAAKAGSTALDGDGANSPFTTALVRHILTPGLDVRLAFGRVRDDVLEATRQTQEPFVYGSLGGRTVSLVEGGATAAGEAATAWAAVKDSTSAAVLGDFIRRYGDTIYATLARERADELRNAAIGDGAVVSDSVRPKMPTQPPASVVPLASVAPGGVPATADSRLRVVLYEEDPNDPAGKQYVGSAVWRRETVSPGPGQPADTVVRANIEIPDRKMTVKWTLRRNLDRALPASHTIEIIFTLPSDFSHSGVQNIPGILMKPAEQTRGVPLAGLAVKVTTNFFLIGLSAVEADMQRNVQLLQERSWFDVPVVYNDGRRAILAVQKGTPGDIAFQQAFAAWTKK